MSKKENIKTYITTLNLDDENDRKVYEFLENTSGKAVSVLIKSMLYAVAEKYKRFDLSSIDSVKVVAGAISNDISGNMNIPVAKLPRNNSIVPVNHKNHTTTSKSLPKSKSQSVDSADEYAKYRGFGFTDEQLELIKQIDERHVRNGEGADAWVGDIESVKNDYGKYREYAKRHGFEFTAKQLRFAKSQDDDYIKQGKGPDYWEKDVDVIREM